MDPVVSLSEIKSDMFKALAHPARIRALEVLVEGERSVSDLQPEVGIELPHLSQQLGVLRRAGLVSTRREGTTVFYSIKDDRLVDLMAVARSLLISSLEESREMLEVLTLEEA